MTDEDWVTIIASLVAAFLIYFVFARLEEKKKEKFEKRDN